MEHAGLWYILSGYEYYWTMDKQMNPPHMNKKIQIFLSTRSCAALRAADLEWIVGPGYSSGRNKAKTSLTRGHNWPFRCLDSFAKYYVLSNHNNFGQEGGRAGINKNVTDTFRHLRGVTTDLGGGQGRNKQKRYRHFSSLTRGHKQKRYRHFSSLTRGHNWPFRCLDIKRSNCMILLPFYRRNSGIPSAIQRPPDQVINSKQGTFQLFFIVFFSLTKSNRFMIWNIATGMET